MISQLTYLTAVARNTDMHRAAELHRQAVAVAPRDATTESRTAPKTRSFLALRRRPKLA